MLRFVYFEVDYLICPCFKAKFQKSNKQMYFISLVNRKKKLKRKGSMKNILIEVKMFQWLVRVRVRARVRWRVKTLMLVFLLIQCLPHPMPQVSFTTLQGHVVLLGLNRYLPAKVPVILEVLELIL